jgi:hypothetical protein
MDAICKCVTWKQNLVSYSSKSLISVEHSFLNICFCSILNPILWIVLYYWTNQKLRNECSTEIKDLDEYDTKFCFHVTHLHIASMFILLSEIILFCICRQRRRQEWNYFFCFSNLQYNQLPNVLQFFYSFVLQFTHIFEK